MGSRRDFIKKTVLGSVSLFASTSFLSKAGILRSDKEIGVQIYSVRDLVNQDVMKALNKIADIGYAYIEGYGLGTDGKILGTYSPEKFSSMVKDAGLWMPSVHASYFTPEDAPVIIEAAKLLGVQQVVIPYLTEDQRNDYSKVAENFDAVGAALRKGGVRFGYHNHAFEFEIQEDGSIPMETLITRTQPENVRFQLDLYWVKKAGFNPEDFIKRYTGRFDSYHIKDADEQLEQTTVGKGIIPFESILSANGVQGIDWFFVEDERTDDPLGNLKSAYNYLQQLNY